MSMFAERIRVASLLRVLLVAGLTGITGLASVTARAESAVDYFPLQVGNQWEYRLGTSFAKNTLRVTGTALVNGLVTYVVTDAFSDQVFFTNDANGIRRHREYYPSEGLDVVFVPPIQQTRADLVVGDSVQSTGTAYATVTGLGTYALSYTVVSTIQNREDVSVPAGSFDALKATGSIRIFGTIGYTPFDETMQITDWLAKHIGAVREYTVDSTESTLLELISTNLDTDGDTVGNAVDNCPSIINTDQADNDGDGAGDACDTDDDDDGVADLTDNCPLVDNADQADYDGDGSGDACDTDDDNDGLSDLEEDDLGTDPLNADTDSDGVSDGDEVTAGRNPLVNEAAAVGVTDYLLSD